MKELTNKNIEMMDKIRHLRKKQRENHDQLLKIKKGILKKDKMKWNKRIEELEKSGKKEKSNNERFHSKKTMEYFIPRELQVSAKLKNTGKSRASVW